MRYLANAFSLSMISPPAVIRVERVGKEEFCKEAEGAVSAIGHAGTAEVLSTICGFKIPVQRIMISLAHGDEVLVFQLLERLPEGKVLSREEVEKLLAEGKATFYRVMVE